MPGMDGLEATRRIRLLQVTCARVPIVALTAQAFAEQVAQDLAYRPISRFARP
jgi:CheY-like chemotaxis protein